jgi:hypothetical protein
MIRSTTGRRLAGAIFLAAAVAAPAMADGLQRFEQVIKPTIPPGILTYGSGTALGDRGFVLKNLVMTPPPEPGKPASPPLKIESVTVEDLDYDAIGKQLPPTFARFRIEGAVLDSATLPDLDLKGTLGMDRLRTTAIVDYRVDPATQVLTLSRLEIAVDGLARFDLSLVMDGVDPADVAKPDAKDKAALRSATFTYDDQSLLSKLIPVAGQMGDTKMDGDTLVAGIVLMLNLDRASASPSGIAVLDALSAYLEDYKRPKGSLRVTSNPPDKLRAAQLPDSPSVTDGLMKAAGLSVSYAGTRPWKPSPAAAPVAATPGPAPSGSCTAGGRYFVLSDNAWYAATAKEPSASGKSCILQADGASPGESITADTTDVIAWSLDGPGTATDRCQKGDKVLAESDGIWYPAQVKAARKRDGTCPVHFDDYGADEDEDVPLKRMRLLKR